MLELKLSYGWPPYRKTRSNLQRRTRDKLCVVGTIVSKDTNELLVGGKLELKEVTTYTIQREAEQYNFVAKSDSLEAEVGDSVIATLTKVEVYTDPESAEVPALIRTVDRILDDDTFFWKNKYGTKYHVGTINGIVADTKKPLE